MKYFYVEYEVSEDYPSYNFVIKAENMAEAQKKVIKILKADYPEVWDFRKCFSMWECDGKTLLQRLTIN